MVSGRDSVQDADGGEQDALFGIQTRAGTILRGTIVPPSPGGPAGREGIRQFPGTGQERSPPSSVRSSGQDWSALRDAEGAAQGQMGPPEPRRPEEDRTSPFRAAEGAPPFTFLADWPALELRREWLGNPRGTLQRTFGKSMERERPDARLEPLRGPRQEGRNTPEEDNPALWDKREAPPARFWMEGDNWNDTLGHQIPPRAEGLEGSPMHLQLPSVAPAQMARHQSNLEGCDDCARLSLAGTLDS
jgi:hypothetical protein